MADTPFNDDEIKKFGSAIEDLKDALFGATDDAKTIAAAFRDSTTSTRDIFTNTTKLKDALEDSLELYSRLGTSYISLSSVQSRVTKNELMRESIMNRIVKLSNNVGESEEHIRNVIDQIRSDSFLIQDENDNILKLLVNQLDSVEGIDAAHKQILDKLEQSNQQYAQFYAKSSAIKKMLSSIANIPIIGPFLEFQTIGDKFMQSTQSGFKEIVRQGRELMKQDFIKFFLKLSVGAYIFGKVIDAFKGYAKIMFELDKGVTSLSNNLGMSKDAGEALYATFYHTSKDSGILFGSGGLVDGLDKSFYSVRNMVAATTELQDSLGTNAMLTDTTVQTQILMTKQMKMTSEEAAGIQSLSLLTGKSADKTLQTIIKQNNASLSYRKILKEVASISGELSMRYANDPEQIAKAVVQANKLGMSLEETRKISSSLLNFEQSIEGELESELLLGRQFNFEKARELALMGKSAEAAGELLSQIGGINELEKMNVIQRERVAAAIGLSSDELSKAAIKEQVLRNLGLENEDALKERVRTLRDHNDLAGIAALQQEAAKVRGGDILLQDIAKASMAEKYEETINKVKDLLAVILQHSTAIKIAFVALASIAAAIAASMITAAVASVIATGGLSAAGAGLAVGAITAIAGGIGVTAVSDSFTEPGGKTISMPENTLLPSKKDYVMTSTTNPLEAMGNKDNSDMIAKLDELIYHTAAGKQIKYDTITAGTAHGMSYNSYA